ncbi:MgtC/SapB family protein [Pseudomonas sp. B21-056]|jgi:putative Mg2+ transporter-C (MgtC) family protein|uniref:MgtC/SapB family protein n=1 Tax=Pseudomonas sp. B21-056 TaxID=2895495 RepID=UPI002231AC24|nr:MgtC/SapB family protein [Pseudomonas sp. B21-056]UZE26224.1 MgtC/SapB family protein [Pseudomonas sp. B21-056]
MYITQHMDLTASLNTLASLLTAFLLGAVIGLERQYRQRTAGLRTNVLVAVGAALFVDVAMRFHAIYGGPASPLHVVAYVVSGVGFLGAGVIMREEGNIRGINTAATLWGSAAVGVAAGTGMLIEAVLGTLFVLSANTLLRPIVNAINRQPLDVESVEVTNTVYVIADKERQKEIMKALEVSLESGRYPVHDLEVNAFGEDDVEIEATLTVTSIDGDELDALMLKLTALPGVRQAFWSPSTTG